MSESTVTFIEIVRAAQPRRRELRPCTTPGCGGRAAMHSQFCNRCRYDKGLLRPRGKAL